MVNDEGSGVILGIAGTVAAYFIGKFIWSLWELFDEVASLRHDFKELTIRNNQNENSLSYMHERVGTLEKPKDTKSCPERETK